MNQRLSTAFNAMREAADKAARKRRALAWWTHRSLSAAFNAFRSAKTHCLTPCSYPLLVSSANLILQVLLSIPKAIVSWSFLSLTLLWYCVLASFSVVEVTSQVLVCVVVLRENAGNRVRKQRALLFWTQQSLATAFNAFRYLTCFASGATLLHGCHAIHVELMHHCCTAIKLCKSL